MTRVARTWLDRATRPRNRTGAFVRPVGMKALPAVVAAFALGLAGCATTATTPPKPVEPKTGPMIVSADIADNGHTVTLATGQRLVVSLDSTYWTFTAPTGVVRAVGRPTVAASHRCVPGGGCGTVTEVFDAVGKGRTTIAANRTTCGEVMRCGANNGTYRLTVIVRAAS